jgi:N-formylglutamate deformylase
MTGAIEVCPGIYLRYEPAGPSVPVVVDVSRSGREYPHDFRSPIPFSVLHDNVSMYVEKLCGSAPALGATMLYACFPNTYIDTNRSAADIDERLIEGEWPAPIENSDFTERGLGLIKRLSRYGEDMQERKLTVEEVQARLYDYHEPYHLELSRILSQMQSAHGRAYQVSCHCMSAIGAPTHADPGEARADFNLGDVHGTTCTSEFLQFMKKTLEDRGHSVSVNFPYYGGYLTRRHSDPENGVESIFVEINKRMFIDTKTFKQNEGFSLVKATMDHLIKQVCRYAAS